MKSGSLLNKLNRRLGLLGCLFILLLMTACGTLEVGLAPTAEPLSRPGVPFTPTPWFGPAQYETEANIVFDDRLKLLGYTVQPEASELSSNITVTLFWEVLAKIDADYNTFVHIFNEQEQLLTQSDLPTGSGRRESPYWLIKEVVYDQHNLVLPSRIGLDEVQIQIGLYDFKDGQRLNVESPSSYTLELTASPVPVTRALKKPTPTTAPQAPAQTAPRPTETPEVKEATAVPQQASEELRIAYVKDSNAWLWQAGTGPLPLTEDGGVESVWISGDGQYIAFIRDENLWVVDSDGNNERQLTTDEDFEGLDLGEELDPMWTSTRLLNVAWRPDSHELFFKTSPQHEGPGLFLSNDLWMIDVDSGEVSMVLPPGEGGRFYLSPDGRLLAVVTPGRIDLMAPDGSNRREAFTHTPVITYSEFEYYAQPVWAADSGSLRVTIPPTDFLADAIQPTSIWYIPVEDQPARLIGEITTHSGGQQPPFFAPDFSRLAYLVGDRPENREVNNQTGIGISEMSESVIWEPVVFEEEIRNTYGWSPDGLRFLVSIPTANVAEIVMGQPGFKPLVNSQDLPILNLTWTDNFRFLYAQVIDDVWYIFLGHADRGEPDLIDSGVHGPGSYDFTWVSLETAEN